MKVYGVDLGGRRDQFLGRQETIMEGGSEPDKAHGMQAYFAEETSSAVSDDTARSNITRTKPPVL